MEARARPNGSVSGHQDLKTELKEMLEVVIVPEKSGVLEQCIYKVPPLIRDTNPKAYTPLIVSIGPIHHKPRGSGGENNTLEEMEEIKLKYLKGFLNRTQRCVGDFVLKLEEWEDAIRSCYAGPVKYNSNDFLKMIIIDACFIIELFLRWYQPEDWEEIDPILLKPWLHQYICIDLILLENQLPMFVLDDIYNLADINHNPCGRNPQSPSFLDIAFDYFEYYNRQNMNPKSVSPKHFTDLLRSFLLPISIDQGKKEQRHPIEHVYSASQLSEAGLVFKVGGETECLLDLKFDKKGVLTMPHLIVDDATEVYMRNIMAFEECHLPYSAYITQYFSILDFLINTEKDVSILVDKKIIVNSVGDANSVATMVNNLCKNVIVPYFNPKYLSICKNLNRFYKNPCNKYKAILVHDYFNTPWKIASTIAAVLLLLLTLIQTIYSVR